MRLAGTKLAANHQYRGFGDQLYDLSGQRPSLDLNFSSTKSLVDATTGQNLVTFTRASSGTYVGSDGVLRTATTNLLLRSEEFDSASWGKTGTTVTANVAAAPNGTATADKIVEDTSNGTHLVSQFIPASSTSYVYSVYAKAGERTKLVFSGGGFAAQGFAATFNLSNGTLDTNTGSRGSIVAAGNGWYRCIVSFTTSNTTTLAWNLADQSGGNSYIGDGASGLFLWGAQLEQSSTVGEYIPTTSTINSAPRFDHSPTTGESLGLLVEEQRTNLLFQSENFGTTWVPFGLLAFGSGSTLNAASAPDGQTTADLIVENTANAQHNISQAITTTGAKRFSVFAKQGSGTRLLRMVDFNPTDGGLGETYFNLSTGTVVSGTGSIQAFPNGWYRCSIQSTTTVTSTYYLSLAPNNTTFTYTGDGTSGIYLWGAQLEAGSFPTSYIPTTTATATRSADVASITGSNFSSWYRQDEGTVFADVNSAPVNNIAQLTYDISEGVGSDRMFQRRNTGGILATAVVDNGVTQGDIGSVVIGASARYRSGFAYKLNDLEIVVNGGGSATDTSATVPTPDRLHIGQNYAFGQSCNGTIRRLTYFPIRLANEVLQRITQ